LLPGSSAHKRGREDREQADADPRRGCVDVEPERDAGQDDDQCTGHVQLDHVVADVTLDVKPYLQTWIVTWKKRKRNSRNG